MQRRTLVKERYISMMLAVLMIFTSTPTTVFALDGGPAYSSGAVITAEPVMESGAPEVPVCICTEKCYEDDYNHDCPVCRQNYLSCAMGDSLVYTVCADIDESNDFLSGYLVLRSALAEMAEEDEKYAAFTTRFEDMQAHLEACVYCKAQIAEGGECYYSYNSLSDPCDAVKTLYELLPAAAEITAESENEYVDDIKAQLEEAKAAYDELSAKDKSRFIKNNAGLISSADALAEAIEEAEAARPAPVMLMSNGLLGTPYQAASMADFTADISAAEALLDSAGEAEWCPNGYTDDTDSDREYTGKVLVLNGVEFTSTSQGGASRPAVKLPADTTVVLHGDNTITCTGDGQNAYGILGAGNITFAGTGSLVATITGNPSSSGDIIVGICSEGTLVIDGSATVSGIANEFAQASADVYGIKADSIEVKGGATLKGTSVGASTVGGFSSDLVGVMSEGDITMGGVNAKIEAKGGTRNSNNGGKSYGISADKLVMRSGTVYTTGYDNATLITNGIKDSVGSSLSAESNTATGGAAAYETAAASCTTAMMLDATGLCCDATYNDVKFKTCQVIVKPSLKYDARGLVANPAPSAIQGLAFSSVAAPTFDGFTFDGWYTGIDGTDAADTPAFTGKLDASKLTALSNTGSDVIVYAKWMKGAKAVRTRPLILTADESSALEGWSYTGDTLTLDGTVIYTRNAVAALQKATGSLKIVLKDGTSNAISNYYFDDSFGTNNHGILLSGSGGKLTIEGEAAATGKLNVTVGEIDDGDAATDAAADTISSYGIKAAAMEISACAVDAKCSTISSGVGSPKRIGILITASGIDDATDGIKLATNGKLTAYAIDFGIRCEKNIILGENTKLTSRGQPAVAAKTGITASGTEQLTAAGAIGRDTEDASLTQAGIGTYTLDAVDYTTVMSGGSKAGAAQLVICPLIIFDPLGDEYYIRNGSGVSLGPTRYRVGIDTVTLPTEPLLREGCTFGGWFTEYDGEGTEITEENAASLSTTYPNGTTIYAMWLKDGKKLRLERLDFSTISETNNQHSVYSAANGGTYENAEQGWKYETDIGGNKARLTLDGVNISASSRDKNTTNSIYLGDRDTEIIIADGSENVIDNPYDYRSPADGKYFTSILSDANITITGGNENSGTLNAKIVDTNDPNQLGYFGIYTPGNVTINGGKMTIYGDTHAINAGGTVTFTGVARCELLSSTRESCVRANSIDIANAYVMGTYNYSDVRYSVEVVTNNGAKVFKKNGADDFAYQAVVVCGDNTIIVYEDSVNGNTSKYKNADSDGADYVIYRLGGNFVNDEASDDYPLLQWKINGEWVDDTAEDSPIDNMEKTEVSFEGYTSPSPEAKIHFRAYTDLLAGNYIFRIANAGKTTFSEEAKFVVGKAAKNHIAQVVVDGVLLNQKQRVRYLAAGSTAQNGTVEGSDFYFYDENAKFISATFDGDNGVVNKVIDTLTVDDGVINYTTKPNLVVDDSDMYYPVIENYLFENNTVDTTLDSGNPYMLLFKVVDKVPAVVSGVSLTGITGGTKAYDTVAVGYTGTPKVRSANESEASMASIPNCHYAYIWQKYDSALPGEDAEKYADITPNAAPKNAGKYRLLVKLDAATEAATGHSGAQKIPFEITKKSLTATADNKVACQYLPLPEASYTVAGFAGTETAASVLADGDIWAEYSVADSNTAGNNIAITMKKKNGLDLANYTLTLINGSLNIAEMVRTDPVTEMPTIPPSGPALIVIDSGALPEGVTMADVSLGMHGDISSEDRELFEELLEGDRQFADCKFIELSIMNGNSPISIRSGHTVNIFIPFADVFPAGTIFTNKKVIAKHLKVDGTAEDINVSMGGTGFTLLDISELSPFAISLADERSSSGRDYRSSPDSYNDEFWSKVEAKLRGMESGDLLNINAGHYDKMPVSTMELLAKKNVSLVITWDNGKPITIPAGQALKAEANRFFWPLSKLEELYKNMQFVPAAVGTAPTGIGNPDTGYIRDVVTGETVAVTGTVSSLEAAVTGLPVTESQKTDIPMMTPADAGVVKQSGSMLPIAIAAAVIGLAAAGYAFYRRKREQDKA